MSTERLLREYVRELLKEEGDGHAGYTAHDIMMSAGSMNPYGMHYGSGDDMYKTFIKPFVDVVQTTTGKAKEMSVKTQTMIRVVFETLATTIVPILRDDYKQAFDNEKKALDKIRSEYAEVYQSNWDAIFNADVAAAAFFYSPATFFTVAFVRKAPGVALDMVSVLTGGKLDGWIDRLRSKIPGTKHRDSVKSHGNRSSDYSGFGPYKKGDKTHLPSGGPSFGADYYEGVVREDVSEGEADAGLEKVVKLLTSDKLKARLEKSPIVKRMQRSGQAVVRNTLEQVFKQAQGVMTANSLHDLQNKTGSKLKDLDKLAQVPAGERQKAEQTILSGVKKSMKEFYVKNLEAQVKAAVDAGVPQDSPYVQDYMKVISKIKGL